MIHENDYPDWHNEVEWLPTIDWNIKFYGAHEQRVSSDWSVPPESHPAFEIVLVLEGEQETAMEGSVYRLQAGDILLIPPGFKHVNRCVSGSGMHYFCAHFNVDDPAFRLELIRHDRILFPSGIEENGRMRSVLDEWIAMARRGGGYTAAERFRLQALLFDLFGMLAQMMANKADAKGFAAPSAAKYAKAIAEALKIRFDPHYRENGRSPDADVRICDVARLLGISPGYALEVFRSVYGVSPRRYLSELKLHEAKAMIDQPGLSLKDIALRLGYANLSHFSRQFKRWTGLSPLQYRNLWT